LRYGIPKPIARSVIVDSIQEELMKRMVLITCALLLITGVALGQGVQTATLIGSVKSEGAPLPGVTVTASSPNLIGERVTVTSGNGDYVIRGVPPGEYKVTFTMDGMQSVEVSVSAGLGVTTRADANMSLSVAAEMITVTADAPTALETTTVGKNTTYEEVQQLPVGRTPTAIAALAGGVTGGDRESSTPVAGQLSISGGMAYDNSFMVNGVNVQDPIFGQTNNLFIEDAIAETQVLSSGISAEYGGFTGGVLNVITKSGGNDFTGSIRGDFTKPEWRDETPYEKGFRGDGVPTAPPTKRSGDLGEVYSLTLGGPIVRDRLWFFGALRDQEDTLPVTLAGDKHHVPRVTTNTRWEVKLTGNITSNHSLQGSYIENPVDSTHEIQVTPIELAAIGINSTRENDGTAIAYNGVLTSKLFAEARYSEKHFGFRGLGGTSTNIVDSPMRNFGHSAFAQQAGTGTFNAPYFDATDPEDRDNEQLYGALSYYLSTGSLGSHDIKGGIEEFTVTRTGGNSQSATNYVFYTPYLTNNGVVVYDNNGRLIPRFINIATCLGLDRPRLVGRDARREARHHHDVVLPSGPLGHQRELDGQHRRALRAGRVGRDRRRRHRSRHRHGGSAPRAHLRPARGRPLQVRRVVRRIRGPLQPVDHRPTTPRSATPPSLWLLRRTERLGPRLRPGLRPEQLRVLLRQRSHRRTSSSRTGSARPRWRRSPSRPAWPFRRADGHEGDLRRPQHEGLHRRLHHDRPGLHADHLRRESTRVASTTSGSGTPTGRAHLPGRPAPGPVQRHAELDGGRQLHLPDRERRQLRG
jgi:hypothetical protein